MNATDRETALQARHGLAPWASLPFVVLALAYQLAVCAAPLEFLLTNVFVMDDAFYNFVCARNLVEHGFVTFDGIHATSGIQPTWPLLLSVLAAFLGERLAFLRGVLVLSALLNLAVALLLRRVGRRVASPAVGELAAIVWAGFGMALAPTMIGMEYSLHVVVILLILERFFALWNAPLEATPRALSAFGLLLVLNVWVRLDSAVFSVAFAALVFARCRRARVPGCARRFAPLIAIALVGALGYGAMCQWMGGEWTPISGLVKKHYSAVHFEAHGFGLALLGYLSWWVRIQLRPIADFASTGLTEHLAWTHPALLAVLLLGLGATFLGARFAWRRRAMDVRLQRFASFLAITMAVAVAHVTLVVATIGHFGQVTQHYWGFLFVGWLLWGSALLVFGWNALDARRARFARIAAVACWTLLQGAVVLGHVRESGRPSALHVRRIALLEWLQRNVPEDARIGAWNSGQLGYFLDRTVVNLDGLANDRHLLEHLRARRPMIDYIRREGISYLVDTDTLEMTMPYRATWPATSFRGLVDRADLEVLWRESEAPDAIWVFRVRRP